MSTWDSPLKNEKRPSSGQQRRQMVGEDVSAKERGGGSPVVGGLELTNVFHAKFLEEIHSSKPTKSSSFTTQKSFSFLETIPSFLELMAILHLVQNIWRNSERYYDARKIVKKDNDLFQPKQKANTKRFCFRAGASPFITLKKTWHSLLLRLSLDVNFPPVWRVFICQIFTRSWNASEF